jgi:hypothetical protein
VPYGSTWVRMAAGAVCASCGMDYDDAVEWCDECDRPEDACMCGRCVECSEYIEDCQSDAPEEVSPHSDCAARTSVRSA